MAEINGRKVALILDYKRTRSGARFDWGGFYHGLDVQLAIYMLAVHHCGAGIADEVAGALYMPIETTPETATLAEFGGGEPRKFPYKAGGIINGAYWPHLDPNASGYSTLLQFLRQEEGQRSVRQVRHQQHSDAGAFQAAAGLGAEGVDPAGDGHRLRQDRSQAVSSRQRAGLRFCEYVGVCHFDWQINDYNFLRSVGKSDLMARVR